MELFSKSLQEDFDRWKREIDSDIYISDKTIGILDVLRGHYLIVDFFASEHGEGVGGVGPKDLGLLHSTMSRQFSGYDKTIKWNTDLEICASLFWGLVKNHAFHDANKRTALLSLFYHLIKVKRYPSAPHREYEQLALRVASNALNIYPKFAKYKNEYDSEVLFIAEFLRKATRNMDKTDYKVTYAQLNNILRKYDFGLANPDKNQIDLIRISHESVGLLGRRKVVVEKRVTSIGFPGWTRQVNVDAVKKVRRIAGLTVENGYDSETFFHDADSLPVLISEFQGLLKRLANK